MELRQQSLTRYITPLREGGSLPALAEADDGFEYVVKFRGAGHGKKALISELIGGEIARALGFHVPELVFLDLDENFGRTEGDEEVQDLLKASTGLNLGLHYLSGAFTVDPYVNEIDDDTASRIVWLDAFITNVDRTVRNTNMLRWNRELWLIDHGAALYFHHAWGDVAQAALTPFAYIRDHALLPRASMIAEADKALRQRITPRTLQKIVGLIPDEWLDWDDTTLSPAELREAYAMFLTTRLANSNIFVKEAINARQRLI
ncbi:HipA family kinase [Muribaculum intestinale]|uniref:HipA family kinase n=1 Tax=Muribaculum intestinale TaxID=1796646 RepID=UPI0024322EE4|nr:HipA family kinase [Muribaculum intestinale]